ncbi:Rrf2 family transcriptional regulator [Sphingobium sufflavum]|uniref:RrF2 family transcriptional regulator n=1 Tax=Sphingobium sufflavum TaxID=1129547 RepID=UPI001F3E293A|nr:Rrf2 family transcriptional regulator [Sphingobium sufflavum]MCE7796462.1 Rrf2 family transcriptional regulator [Sphingobium sufflavum]
MLSQRGRYAIKALLNIARSTGEARQVSLISEEEQIPRKFLESIMSSLRRAGLVRSTRGNMGGYKLARPADLITFGEIVRATDGPLSMLPCVSRNFYQRCDDCPDEYVCQLRALFSDVRDAVTSIMDNRTLADALRRERDARGLEDAGEGGGRVAEVAPSAG